MKRLILTLGLVSLLAGCGGSGDVKTPLTIEETLTQQVRLEQAKNSALQQVLQANESLQRFQIASIVLLGCALAVSLFALARRKSP